MPTKLMDHNPDITRPRDPPHMRYEAGRAQRETVPLETHAELNISKRVKPFAVLLEQDRDRLSDLVPLRYGRMSLTPFTFFRGAAAIMASDLARGARSDIWVELCGDAHLGNFRLYKAPDRRLVFDLNDFDETLPGPFEWDVKRLAASIAVASRNNGFKGSACRAAVRMAIKDYRSFLVEASELDPLGRFYYRFDSDRMQKPFRLRGKKNQKWKESILARAVNKNSQTAHKKLTAIVDGKRMIVPDPPFVIRMEGHLQDNELGQVSAFYRSYLKTLPLNCRLLLNQFSVVDIARRVVGVGSVATRCLIILLEAGDGTPLFLQLKQANRSVLEPHLQRSAFRHNGRRVVEGQRLIQATSDVLLGWARWEQEDNGFDFYVRQLWDGKGKLDIDTMGPKRLTGFAGLCGKTLAYAHARSGDAMMIRGYIGEDSSFDDIMVAFAERYADLTELDHAELAAMIDDGAIAIMRDS